MGEAFLVKTPKYQTETPTVSFSGADIDLLQFNITNNDENTVDISFSTDPDNVTGTFFGLAAGATQLFDVSGLNDGVEYTVTFTAKANGKSASNNVIDIQTTDLAFAPISASGGSISDVNIGGVNYRIHAFTNVGSSTFTVNDIGTEGGLVDILLVAGGGAGGSGGSSSNEPGGGGAGELYFEQNKTLQNGSYSLVVGAGGTGITSDTQNGDNGDNTIFDNLTVLGGGGGGQSNPFDGKNGGSGGGGANAGEGGFSTATIGLGTAGGDGTYFLGNPSGTNNDGGGGGGASQPGNTRYFSAGGDGLDLSNIFGTQYGDNGAFAGGGHGFERSNLIENNDGVGNVNARSLGGGGLPNGWNINTLDPREQGTPLPPIQNTGSGAAGTSDGNIPNDDGAHGIVLIRYRLDPPN